MTLEELNHLHCLERVRLARLPEIVGTIMGVRKEYDGWEYNRGREKVVRGTITVELDAGYKKPDESGKVRRVRRGRYSPSKLDLLSEA